jgi:hypothetical protein
MAGLAMAVQTFGNVCDALAAAPAAAASFKARADLLTALIGQVRSWEVTRQVAAGRDPAPAE